MRHVFALLIIAIHLMMVTVAWANNENSRRAKKKYKEGVQLFSEQKYDDAASAFLKANELKPSWKIFYNIGQCYAAQKKYGEALDAFEYYMFHGGDDIPTNRSSEVIEEMKRLKSLVGALHISGPKGAVVVIDNEEKGVLPLSGNIRVPAGIDHSVKITLNGDILLDKKIKLGGEELAQIHAEEKATPQPAPIQTEMTPTPVVTVKEQAQSPSTKKIIAWTLTGTGAAFLIGAAITGGVALSLDGELTKHCGDDGQCPPEYHDKLDRRNALSITSTVLLASGAVIGTTGILFLTVFRDKHKETQQTVSVTPSIHGTGASAVINWRF